MGQTGEGKQGRGASAWIWCLALAAGVFPIVWRQVTVSDAWWHVALGKWLVEMRSLPDLSKFYFTPFHAESLGSELRWQWLGDIALYLAYAGGGAAGIQWLVVACALAGLFFVAKCGGGMRGPWVWLALVVAALGTYQLQLARNSVFSLALYPALLWLGVRKTGPPDWREYAWAGGLLLLWSCLHGSCVLGWLTACALFGPRALGGFGPGWNWGRGMRAAGLFAAGMGISLVLICWGRPDAMHFLGSPFRHVVQSAEEFAAKPFHPSTAAGQPANSAEPEKQVPSPKEWLNSTIWKRDPAVPWSNDYWSPLDMLPGMRPVEAAYGLAVLALGAALVFRNVPPGLLLAWAGAVFLGLGYVRMFGYTALASGAVLLVAARNGGRVAPGWVAWGGWAGVAAWLVFSWALFFSGRVDAFIPDGQHVSRAGKVPIYDDATADWVRREFPHERVFTTIETGSYCVLRWGFGKAVFLDGFFAPHTREVWDAYHAALRDGDLGPLREGFGVSLAIIPATSPKWVDRFRLSPDWHAVALGGGTVVFAHSSLGAPTGGPRIFMDPGRLRETSHYFRHAALKALFLVAATPVRSGFQPEEWTALPEFGELQRMAPEVFPQAD